jgi:hypothetical protein
LSGEKYPGFDYRTAIHFPSAMHVLAFASRIELKNIDYEVKARDYMTKEAEDKKLLILQNLVEWTNSAFDGFCKLYYIKRYQSQILRELLDGYDPEDLGKQVYTNFAGLNMMMTKGIKEITESYYLNSRKIYPAEVELPQYGVMIPFYAHQAMLNPTLLLEPLRDLVAQWVKYRIIEHHSQLSLQSHILTRCEESEATVREKDLAVYGHNKRMMNIGIEDDDKSVQRKEWKCYSTEFSNPDQTSEIKQIESTGNALNLVYWKFDDVASYDQWDLGIKQLYEKRLAMLKDTIPTNGWINHIRPHAEHDDWEWYQSRLKATPNPPAPHHEFKPIVWPNDDS